MSILLASGDYPDMFLATGVSHQFTNEELMLYGKEQGIFIPLNDLIDKYGDSIKNVIETDRNRCSGRKYLRTTLLGACLPLYLPF